MGEALELAAQPQAVATAELIVDDSDVDPLTLRDRHRDLGTADGVDDQEVPVGLEELPQPDSHRGVIIDHEHADQRGRRPRALLCFWLLPSAGLTTVLIGVSLR